MIRHWFGLNRYSNILELIAQFVEHMNHYGMNRVAVLTWGLPYWPGTSRNFVKFYKNFGGIKNDSDLKIQRETVHAVIYRIMSRLYKFHSDWKIITMEVTEDWNLAWIERYLYNYFDLHEIYFTWVSGEIWVSKIKNKQALAFLKNFRCLSLLNFIGCFRRWSLICFGVNSWLDADMIIILVRNRLAIEKN